MAEHDDSDSDVVFDSLDELSKVKKKIRFPSCRLVLSVMGFLGFVNVYALRVNLSVAMVAMVNSSIEEQKNNSADECPGPPHVNGTSEFRGDLPWDGKMQGIVLGSFFYGYIFTQIPGGYLSERFGAKWLYGLGILCTAVFTLVTPVAAHFSVNLLIVVRVLEGIGEGVTFPAMMAMLSHWAPPYERSKLGTFIYSGAQFGTVVSLPISGLLCKYGPFGGWPSVFYVFGTLGCLWFVGWAFIVHNYPSTHPRISVEERAYIEGSLGRQIEKKRPIPVMAILKSRCFWAILVAHVSNNWGFYTLLTCLPTYMKEVLKFDISQNGFISAIPYGLQCVMAIGSGQVADYLRKRKIMSTTRVRKLAILIGLGVPAVTLATIGYAGCDKILIVGLLTIAVGIGGVAMAGYGVNHLDLAPPFAGTLLGLTNTAATIPGFVSPQVVGILTNNDPSRGQWQKIFWISSAIYLFGMVFYLIFGSGELQPWGTAEYGEYQREKSNVQYEHLKQEDDTDEVISDRHVIY